MSKIYAKYNAALKRIEAVDPVHDLTAIIISNPAGISVAVDRAKHPVNLDYIKDWNQAEDIFKETIWKQVIDLNFRPASEEYFPKHTLVCTGFTYEQHQPSEDISSDGLATILTFVQDAYKKTVDTIHNEDLKNKVTILNYKLEKQHRAENKLKTAIKQTKKQIK